MKANKAVPHRRNRSPRVQLLAELERAKTEIALLAEELGIKDTRWSRMPPRRRPYYSPILRMRILRRSYVVRSAGGSQLLLINSPGA